MYALQKKGLTASDEQVREMLARVKERSISKRGLVTPEEFDEIAKEVLKRGN